MHAVLCAICLATPPMHHQSWDHSAAVLTGFRRGGIKPRVVPFQISLASVGLPACVVSVTCLLALSLPCPALRANLACHAMHALPSYTDCRLRHSLRLGMLRNGSLRDMCCTKQEQTCAQCSCPSGFLRQQSKLITAHRYSSFCSCTHCVMFRGG